MRKCSLPSTSRRSPKERTFRVAASGSQTTPLRVRRASHCRRTCSSARAYRAGFPADRQLLISIGHCRSSGKRTSRSTLPSFGRTVSASIHQSEGAAARNLLTARFSTRLPCRRRRALSQYNNPKKRGKTAPSATALDSKARRANAPHDSRAEPNRGHNPVEDHEAEFRPPRGEFFPMLRLVHWCCE